MARTRPVIDAAPTGEPVVLDDGQMDAVIAQAEREVEEAPLVRSRTIAPRDPDPETRDETPTLVVCVVECNPWANGRKIRHKEKVEVPRWLADVMVKNGHVVIV